MSKSSGGGYGTRLQRTTTEVNINIDGAAVIFLTSLVLFGYCIGTGIRIAMTPDVSIYTKEVCSER